MILRHDVKVWNEGFRVGENTKSEADAAARGLHCPYRAGSAEAWSWYSGFIEGRALLQSLT